ncbi:hypothetical protein PMAYCL1PPCAC_22430, partial [Pristionchus mayeri]
CTECGKKLGSKRALQHHMWIHTDEKLKCLYCNTYYHSLSARESHVHSVHDKEVNSDEVKYDCENQTA